MKSFEYARPANLGDATRLLTNRWDEAGLLAGGTDLITSLKQEIIAPKRVVSLKAIPSLSGIEIAEREAQIGAMTSLAEISEHAAIRENFPSLVYAIDGIGSPQIIAMGTLGGNLCQRPRCWYYRQGFGLLGQFEGKSLIPDGDNRYHAIFGNQGPAYFVCPSSLAPALIVLGATLHITGPNDRTREVKVSEFYRIPQAANERENVLEPNEIVTRISIPLSGLANASYKVAHRAAMDWPLVTASVAFESATAARNAAICLGLVAPKPWPVAGAAAVLEGKAVDEALAAKAGEAAAEGATPLSRNEYKVQLVKTAVKRAILIAAGLMEG